MASEQQNAWVSRVLGFNGAATSPTAPSPDQRQDVIDRLKIVNDDMRLYGLVKELTGPLTNVAQAVKVGDPSAAALLDDLERQIAAAAGRKRVEGAQKTAKEAAISAKAGLVAMAQIRIKLAMARSSYGVARDNLHAACTKLLETPNFANDPRSTAPETLASIASIGERVPSIEECAGEIEDALDAMSSTLDAQMRSTARIAAMKAIGEYREALDADPILTRMQNTEAGTFPIKDAITEALQALETALAA